MLIIVFKFNVSNVVMCFVLFLGIRAAFKIAETQAMKRGLNPTVISKVNND